VNVKMLRNVRIELKEFIERLELCTRCKRKMTVKELATQGKP
jgi:hypothetical protein